jgi:hypothetical protein
MKSEAKFGQILVQVEVRSKIRTNFRTWSCPKVRTKKNAGRNLDTTSQPRITGPSWVRLPPAVLPEWNRFLFYFIQTLRHTVVFCPLNVEVQINAQNGEHGSIPAIAAPHYFSPSCLSSTNSARSRSQDSNCPHQTTNFKMKLSSNSKSWWAHLKLWLKSSQTSEGTDKKFKRSLARSDETTHCPLWTPHASLLDFWHNHKLVY